MSAEAPRPRPLIAHVVYRFSTGGTENGMVNLINHLPDTLRHAVIALDDIDAGFAARLRRRDVELVALRKPPGHGFRVYPQLYRLFRQLRPSILHTRNLAALEAALPAWAAGVPARIHGEHGWDILDPGGRSRSRRWVRRLYRPFVTRYVAVSCGLVDYLGEIGIAPADVEQIYNGVDPDRYHPAAGGRPLPPGCPFEGEGLWFVGTVGRMQPVKDTLNLVHAFVHAASAPAMRSRLRLVMVGDGPLRDDAAAVLSSAGLSNHAWLPGERADIPDLMRMLDCFVLPSLAEGISNTILEAMATGLPVIATDVGGNPELVEEGRTGRLVQSGDSRALGAAIADLAGDPVRAREMGHAGRARVEAEFSLDVMVRRYRQLYERLLPVPGPLEAGAPATE